MTYKFVMEMTGEPLTTLTHTCDDTAETLDDVTGFVFQTTVTKAGAPFKANVVAVLITCEDYDIKFAWGTNPVQAGVGHILAVGQSMKLTNYKQINDFRFINENNGEDAVLQITPEISST